MDESNEKIFIEWQINQSDPDHPLYELRSTRTDGVYANLVVNLPITKENPERWSRAKLIEMMFEKAESLGVDVSRLRFHV